MNEIKLYSHNVRSGGLADPERALRIAEQAAEAEPRIAFFYEALPEDGQIDPAALSVLEKNIGKVRIENYGDPDGRVDRHALIAVASPDFGDPAVSFNAGRAALTFHDTLPFSITGFHGYDRSRIDGVSHDRLRRRQVAQLLSRVASRAIVCGDFNSTHREDTIAAILRFAGPFAGMLPASEPGEEQTLLSRSGSLAQRLAAMAEGGSLRDLKEAGFTDADPRHQPTMRKLGIMAVQLDHIMGRGVEFGGDFTVHPRNDLSDHSAISVTAVV